jgi:hypothetical protein
MLDKLLCNSASSQTVVPPAALSVLQHPSLHSQSYAGQAAVALHPLLNLS